MWLKLCRQAIGSSTSKGVLWPFMKPVSALVSIKLEMEWIARSKIRLQIISAESTILMINPHMLHTSIWCGAHTQSIALQPRTTVKLVHFIAIFGAPALSCRYIHSKLERWGLIGTGCSSSSLGDSLTVDSMLLFIYFDFNHPPRSTLFGLSIWWYLLSNLFLIEREWKLFDCYCRKAQRVCSERES